MTATILQFPTRPLAALRRACDVIWMPELHPLAEVARAAELVLSSPGATDNDALQASRVLLTIVMFGAHQVLGAGRV